MGCCGVLYFFFILFIIYYHHYIYYYYYHYYILYYYSLPSPSSSFVRSGSSCMTSIHCMQPTPTAAATACQNQPTRLGLGTVVDNAAVEYFIRNLTWADPTVQSQHHSAWCSYWQRLHGSARLESALSTVLQLWFR